MSNAKCLISNIELPNRRTPNKRSAEKIEIVVAALDLAPNQLSKDLFLKLKGLGRGQTAAGQKAG